MEIRPIASTITDNFMYLVVDGSDGLLVDPVDADAAVAAVRDAGLESVRILTTHGHPDHAGGNAATVAGLAALGLECPVLASRHQSTFDVPHDETVGDEDRIEVGSTQFRVFHAPGHTDGHIVAFTEGHLISGDLIFVAGAGNCRFGGDPGVLYRVYSAKLPGLPDETRFYPGHDYAQRNLEFVLSVEPDNAEARRRLDALQGHTRDDGPVRTTLGEERSYNPFMRTQDKDLRAHLFEKYPDMETDCANEGERAFRILRGLRDAF